MSTETRGNQRRAVSKPIVLIGIAALVAFLVLNGHGNHLLSLAPLLILLACPLMHLFMHHGHGGHGRSERPEAEPADRSGPP